MTAPTPRYGVLAAAAAAVAVAAGCAGCTGAAAPSPAAATSAAISAPAASAAGSRVAPPVAAPANAVPAGTRGTPRGGIVTSVRRGDPTSVADAVAATAFRWDTRIDRSPQDAARRAVGWMTPQEAARTTAAATSGGGAAWAALAAHHGWTSTTVRGDTELPAPTTNTGAARRVVVTVTAHTGDRTRLPGQSWLVLVTLQQAGRHAWLASQVLPQPDGTGQP